MSNATNTAAATTVVTTVNPATDEILAEYRTHDDGAVEAILGAAVVAQASWRDVPVEERARRVGTVAEVLERERDSLAHLISTEMGKPLGESLAEIDKCAWNCRQYVDDGPRLLRASDIETAASSTYVTYEPLGVLLAVMPWNFPFWQLFRFAVPAMVAGNGVLLKHAPNVTGCALEIERVFREADLPADLLRTLVVEEPRVPEVSEQLIADSRIAGVTLTGSTRAGSAVAMAAGRALKKSVLELGGSDPFVVLADADLATAATHAAKSRLMCAGQTCIAAKRLIVHRDVADEFSELFVAEVRKMEVGDPLAAKTQVGPLARRDLVEALDRQLKESVAAGATVLLGGGPTEGPGSFFLPAVLSHVPDSAPVLTEETFGPVAVVIVADGDDDAVAIANDTPYGLAASVWSADVDHALAVGARIESGALAINTFVASDPRLSFGGVKMSGYGRELGMAGIREFTNARSTWIA